MKRTTRKRYAAILLLTATRIAGAQVDHGPIPHVDSTLLRFPDMLRSAHVGGSGHVTVTIDSTGRLIRSGLQTIDASQSLFSYAIRVALDRMTFEPAVRDGRRVEASLEIDAEFHMPDPYYVPRVAVWRVDSIAGGFRFVTGWDAIPRVQPPPVLSAADDRAVKKAVLDAVRRMSDPAPGEELQSARLTPWTPDVVALEGRTWTPRSGKIWGASGRVIWCQISRTDATAAWTVQCEETGRWVS